ncbi:MAG: FAD-dependent oxidoreductase [Cyclobacteriaceae bacterium]|nr:FAD-dependent oxidoreductase [Cyclobacteriaceae bacterium HetDA_MAG_MS6]
MGSLTTACLLANAGLKVQILESNWIPGGCTSSYWRKGFVFESGATTLVGLDEGMPLKYLIDQIGINIPTRELHLPMQVQLQDGRVISRHKDISDWISEAERFFKGDQRGFWETAYEISHFVWNASLRFTAFPPSKLSDIWQTIKKTSLRDFVFAKYAFVSTSRMMKKFNVYSPDFIAFVNEQLLITAQNKVDEVNFLFGAAALCYTNYGNYYLDGGLIELVNPLVDFVRKKGGEIEYRNPVTKIKSSLNGYLVQTKNKTFTSKYLVSGIPINNTVELFSNKLKNTFDGKMLASPKLNSAFQMGVGFSPHRDFDTLHHQLHLSNPLPGTGSNSIFLSLSHPDDSSRSDEKGLMVASISTHLPDPAYTIVDSTTLEQLILKELEDRNLILTKNIRYQHSSSSKSWSKWTKRKWGFVGGYPQYIKTKPWQMIDARLDGHRAYQVGDTTYPGQGIPGTVLSGIIAFEKMKRDWKF